MNFCPHCGQNLTAGSSSDYGHMRTGDPFKVSQLIVQTAGTSWYMTWTLTASGYDETWKNRLYQMAKNRVATESRKVLEALRNAKLIEASHLAQVGHNGDKITSQGDKFTLTIKSFAELPRMDYPQQEKVKTFLKKLFKAEIKPF